MADLENGGIENGQAIAAHDEAVRPHE